MTYTEDADVVIVGTGHAGAHAAVSLRQRKFTGSIALVGAEPDLPYERPPLSKQYLAQSKSFEHIQLRAAAFWAQHNITLHCGHRVVALDPANKTLHLEDGRRLSYGRLIWSAGGRARRLTCTGHSVNGVHTLRSRADVDRLIAELPGVQRVVVVGGGYIGLEVAATLVKLGKQITVLESCERVLARVAGPPLAEFYAAQHRLHGVDVRVNTTVQGIEHRDGRVTGVRLSSSQVLPADLVIVGIGILPEIEVLAQAGARVANGVEVDSYCRTSLADVFAIGDCAQHVNTYSHGQLIRLESVQNATDQAMIVARFITGQPTHYDAIPWFWSDQYELRLQTVGLNLGYDDLVLRGDPLEGRFSIVYLRDSVPIALDCVNSPRDFVQGKSLVRKRSRVDRQRLADSGLPLETV
jgi:3-phenylpropionate/trans-cinnamate dioxygenase ferredoxin reductase subunit